MTTNNDKPLIPKKPTIEIVIKLKGIYKSILTAIKLKIYIIKGARINDRNNIDLFFMKNTSKNSMSKTSI